MGKIAIVGVEGSGKTVLMAALGAAYEHPDENGMFLTPKNQDAFKFSMSYMHLMRNRQQWPSATMTDSLRYLEWELRTRNEMIAELSLLDYAGEVYRRAFSEDGDGQQYAAEMEALFQHITEADTLLILVNLRDVIDGDRSSTRTLETLWLNKSILEFARKVPTITNIAIILTQADKYRNAIEQCGGPGKTLEKYLPFVMNIYHDIPVFAVSAVDRTEPDDNGIPQPAKDFQSIGVQELIRWLIEINPEGCRIISALQARRENIQQRVKTVNLLAEEYRNSSSECNKNRRAIADRWVNATAALAEACKNSPDIALSESEVKEIKDRASRALNFETSVAEALKHLAESGPDAAVQRVEKSAEAVPEYEDVLTRTVHEIQEEYNSIVEKFNEMFAGVQSVMDQYHEHANAPGEERKKIAITWHARAKALADLVDRSPGISIDRTQAASMTAQAAAALKFENAISDILIKIAELGYEEALKQAGEQWEAQPVFRASRSAVETEIRQNYDHIAAMRKKRAKRRLWSLLLVLAALAFLAVFSLITAGINARAAHEKEINDKRQQGYCIVSRDGKEIALWEEGVSSPSRQGVISSKRPGYWKLIYPYRWKNDASGENREERIYETGAVWCPYLPHPEHRNIVSGQSAGTYIPAPGYRMVDAGKLTVAWTPGVPHPQNRGITSDKEEGYWSLNAGYTWKNGSGFRELRTSNLETAWAPGSVHPQHTHFIAGTGEGVWNAAPGYADEGNFKSRWVSGKAHPENTALISGEKEGTWIATTPGYVWDGKTGVRWQKGITSDQYPHWITISTEENPSGYWNPQPGYVRKDSNASGLSELIWSSGEQHPDCRDLISSREEGKWTVRADKPGYAWNGAAGIVWKAGMTHPRCRDLVSAYGEGQWITHKPAYVWDGRDGIKWQSGVSHPTCEGLISTDMETQWVSNKDGYAWDGQNGLTWKSGLPSGKTLPPHWISVTEKDTWRPEDGYVKVDPQNKYVSPLKWDSSWNNGNKRATGMEGMFEYKKSCWKCSGSGKTNVDVTCDNCKGIWKQPCNPVGVVSALAANGVHYMQCSQCQGNGRVWVTRGLLNSGWEVCNRCNGLGGVVCTNCGGSGVWTCPNCKNGVVHQSAECDRCKGLGYTWE